MKLLVFGANGQVAREIAARAGPGLRVEALSRNEADLADPPACAARIADTRADAVINAAAHTAVDRAEAEEALAMAINGEAPGAMARACAARGLPFVHLSSDYVFDGSGTAPWRPEAPAAPLNAYGRSKLAGEMAVRAAGGAAAILRTSWVFSAHGGNFVKTMLRLGAERDRLPVVDDQHGGPTWAGDIAIAAIAIAARLRQAPQLAGTYHYSGAPGVSRAGFAREILTRAGLPCAVEPVPTRAYPTPARRPLNTRLDCRRTGAVFGLDRPDWRPALAGVLAQILTQTMARSLATMPAAPLATAPATVLAGRRATPGAARTQMETDCP